MTALMRFKNVCIEYDGKTVLEDINLDIREGAFVSIVGPSGAGKSSLLRLILGQEAPSRGTITLDGVPMRAECGPDRGVVFQRYSVFPHLTVLQNTLFGLECVQSPITGRLFGAKRKAAGDEAIAMLEAVGLGDSLHAYPAQLSGGMQQRLAIAQALIKRPRILLLDEPFGALDPGIRADMQELTLRLWEEYALTVIMVTHDLKEAFSLGTRVLVLDKRGDSANPAEGSGATTVYDLPLSKRRMEGAMT